MTPDSPGPGRAPESARGRYGAITAVPDDHTGGGGIGLVLSVSAAPVARDVLRGATGRLGHNAGFSFDGIEDLAMAVDDAATLLLDTGPSALELVITGPLSDRRLHLTVSATDPTKSLDLAELREHYRWQLLEALCEAVGWDRSTASITLAQTVR